VKFETGLSVLILILILSCGRGQKEIIYNENIPDSAVIISLQKCITDTSQSYWVAMPPDIDSLKRLPLIIAFDPHGDGKLAVRSLIGAVTDFGYIVAGSNVIRNGYEKIENAFTTLSNDVLNRYPIDRSRIYSAGFSGGGRFAQILSQINQDIKAVISIGAGFIFNKPDPPKNNIPMLFVAGDQDFNYIEIYNSRENLKLSGIRSFVMEFQGKHEWPERHIMDEALLWFELDDCRRNKDRSNDPVIKSYQEMIHENAGRFMAGQEMLLACREYEKGIAFMSGLVSTRSMEKQMELCKESPAYKDKLEKKNSAMNLEMRLQQGYISALNLKDTLWWRNEIRRLDQELQEESDQYLLSAYRRVKSFISIAAYSFCNTAIKDNDLPKAARLIAIYRTVDPSNPDVYYFSALYYSRSGQFQKAAEFFRKAVDSGFTDFQKASIDLPGEIYKAGLPKV